MPKEGNLDPVAHGDIMMKLIVAMVLRQERAGAQRNKQGCTQSGTESMQCWEDALVKFVEEK